MEGQGEEITKSDNERREVSWDDDLPSDLIMEIVSWISPKDAPSMWSVSKKWSEALWSTSIANPCILFMSPDSRNSTRRLWFHTVLQNQPIQKWNENKIDMPLIACPLQYMSPQSVRGWICCHDKKGKSAMLNPTRGVYRMLPKVLELDACAETHFHLGYDRERRVFKVLCIISRGTRKGLRILNLRDENMHWSEVHDPSHAFESPPPSDHSAICLDGKIYLPCDYPFNRVACFDLQTEKFEIIKGIPDWIKGYDRLIKVNGSVAFIIRDTRTGTSSIWTLDTATRTWSRRYVIPPLPPHSPNTTYTCLGTIGGTNKFLLIPSTPLTEPLHMIYYDPETTDTPQKIFIDCQTSPPSRHIVASLDFLETPNFRSKLGN
ncbi:unnamed protein product [Eruca vesicaria subsp. sativa]|uniref:F-box domain-containing protein n=1 Tax=Eruca vesicaria subsp. sativa TaxID=29727 RepID=A0ABC8LVH5_ERUVS|nr:unnamed protein product [Eruca vesicaria subsp. sativa]